MMTARFSARAVAVWRLGGTEAGTHLRMIPTSPRSPLRFRTAGFPQYDWKAGGGTTPHRRQSCVTSMLVSTI
jgi:hypothetical protein